MSYGEYQEKLKQKLWTAIDGLDDSDGFVLVASVDEVVFTKLVSAGWEEHTLEIEPLQEAELRAENQRTYEQRRELIAEQASLASKISHKKRELAQLEAAIAKLTGTTPVKGETK